MTEDTIKILLVDDVEDNLTAVSGVIAGPGIEIVAVRSGGEALEMLLRHELALALVDVHMPGMNGFELAELMRGTERTRHIPIIFFTAAPEEVARVFRGYELGAVDFLFKPIDPRLLRGKVDTFVEVARQRRLLSQKLRELEESIRLSDMFIGVLGHDLRSPLQSVVLSATLVGAKAQDPHAVRAAALTIERAARRMGGLVDQLLDFARARARGGIPIRPVPCDAKELVQAAVADLDPVAAGRVRVHAEGDLRGTWDRDRLLQVMTNLLQNAVQHGAGGGVIEVELDGAERPVVRIAVANAGHMPAKRMRTLFEPFVGEGYRRPSEGLGLGLYIVHQIVLGHGGDVRVRSDPERGTRFAIELPREAARAGASAP